MPIVRWSQPLEQWYQEAMACSSTGERWRITPKGPAYLQELEEARAARSVARGSEEIVAQGKGDESSDAEIVAQGKGKGEGQGKGDDAQEALTVELLSGDAAREDLTLLSMFGGHLALLLAAREEAKGKAKGKGKD